MSERGSSELNFYERSLNNCITALNYCSCLNACFTVVCCATFGWLVHLFVHLSVCWSSLLVSNKALKVFSRFFFFILFNLEGVDGKFKGFSLKQDRIQGYPSRKRVGTGSICVVWVEHLTQKYPNNTPIIVKVLIQLHSYETTFYSSPYGRLRLETGN